MYQCIKKRGIYLSLMDFICLLWSLWQGLNFTELGAVLNMSSYILLLALHGLLDSIQGKHFLLGIPGISQEQGDGATSGKFESEQGSGERKEGIEHEQHEQVPYTTLSQFDVSEVLIKTVTVLGCARSMRSGSTLLSSGHVLRPATLVGLGRMSKLLKTSSWSFSGCTFLEVAFLCQLSCRYIQGENNQRVKISMTVPVLSRLRKYPDNKVNKQMCFYLEKKYQELELKKEEDRK